MARPFAARREALPVSLFVATRYLGPEPSCRGYSGGDAPCARSSPARGLGAGEADYVRGAGAGGGGNRLSAGAGMAGAPAGGGRGGGAGGGGGPPTAPGTL